MSASTSGAGLIAALKNTAATLTGMAQTRLELVSNEIQTEKLRLLRQLLLAQAMIFCAGLGLLLAVVLTTLLFWEQRMALVAVFAALFLGLAGFFYAALRRSANASESVFATSVSELQKDLAQLKKAVNRDA